MPFTYSDLQACAEREAKMRRRVYARWIYEGRMTQTKADDEIAKMNAIADHFAVLVAEKERLL